MNMRRIITILVAFILMVSLTALWSVEGDEREGDTATNVVAGSGSDAGTTAPEAPKKKGNRFFRAIKAPFKAVGKIFGGDDSGKLSRMTEKDAERFESVGVVRVEDSNTRRPEVTGAEGSARDLLDRGR